MHAIESVCRRLYSHVIEKLNAARKRAKGNWKQSASGRCSERLIRKRLLFLLWVLTYVYYIFRSSRSLSSNHNDRQQCHQQQYRHHHHHRRFDSIDINIHTYRTLILIVLQNCVFTLPL